MEYMRDAVARITIDEHKIRGTGFLVAEDILATSLHVVADREDGELEFFSGTIKLKFRKFETTAEVIKDAWNVSADCVLLRCTEAPNVRPLPLRQLGESDQDFKTRGYPDIKPSGMMMHGKVVDHESDLDFVQPVIQLYCLEAAAGKGPPIKGMSGAPVMIGSDAVGLLRYALLDDDDCATGGTIFACHARDIIGLDPHGRLNLRPPYAPSTLSDDHRQLLNDLVERALADRAADLELIVKFTLGTSLDGDITGEDEIGKQVRDLLSWAQKQGAGVLQVLMTGIIAAIPAANELVRFCDATVPGGSSVTPDADLVDTGQQGLFALLSIRQFQEVEDTLGGYRKDFETTLTQIDTLSKYKALHTCLHTLQTMLDAIKGDLARTVIDITVRRALSTHSDQLCGLARDVRPDAVGLKTESDELRWIDELDACGQDILAIAQRGNAGGPNATDIARRLDEIQNKAAGINDALYMAARFIELDSLAVTIDEVVGKVAKLVDPAKEAVLMDGSTAISKLRYRLAGLVAEHDEWQWLNERLTLAASNPISATPSRVPSWDEFSERITGLCSIFPEEYWPGAIMQCQSSEAAKTATPVTKTERDSADFDFWTFRRLCVNRFVEVDRELDDLCVAITELGPAIEALLR